MEIVPAAHEHMISSRDIRPAAIAPQPERIDAEMNASYVDAYIAHPIDEPDEWGDLGSFRTAIAR